MRVEILFKDGTIKMFNNIKYVSNGSTNIPNDWIYLYKFNDIPGKPSIRYPMSAVVCVAVGEELYK